jgi:P27 family predicted phage terminase small subunit
MANRGPKPKDAAPTASRGKPTAPSFLDAEAKKQWKRIVGLIDDAGYCSRLDADVLTHYCTLWSRWREAEKQVKVLGAVIRAPNGYLQTNPWYTIATAHIREMKPYLDMLGLSPKARSKIKLSEPDEGASKWDEFEDDEQADPA